MFVKFLSIIALGASAVLALDAPATFNPPESVLAQRSTLQPSPQISARYLTNAERLNAKLPLNPPQRRSRTDHERPRPSGHPRNIARGCIKVKNDKDKTIGFVSKVWNGFGEYGITSVRDERLLVSFNRRDAKEGAADFTAVNGPGAETPYVGGITGFSSTSSDIGPGTSNYAYLGGTVQTPLNAPPAGGINSFTKATNIHEQIESAIFKWNQRSNAITLQWINSDSTKPTTYIGYTQGVLLLTGDKTTFTNSFGPTDWVAFEFVSE